MHLWVYNFASVDSWESYVRHGFRYFKNRGKFILSPQNAVQDKMGTEIGLEVLFAKVAVK
jgi:hypothetical protein